MRGSAFAVPVPSQQARRHCDNRQHQERDQDALDLNPPRRAVFGSTARLHTALHTFVEMNDLSFIRHYVYNLAERTDEIVETSSSVRARDEHDRGSS